jgi:hypothetical protein
MAGMPDRQSLGHGTRARYARGCRCPACREGSRLYHKRLRENRQPPGWVDATGTARKLRALFANGWPWTALAERMGKTERWPSMLARQPNPNVTAATFAIVDALWRELRDTPGPSATARGWARKLGWPAPEYWAFGDIDDPELEQRVDVDMTAVGYALAGRIVPLTQVERHYAVHAGRDRGMTYTAIGNALRMSATRAQELGARPLPEDCEVAA